MKKVERKTSHPDSEAQILQDLTETQTSISESHGMALNRPFGAEESIENNFAQSNIEFHLTISTEIDLTPRQMSLLLDVLNYQAVRFGVTFNMVLAMWELYFRLLGNKKSASWISDGKIKVTVSVTEIILRTMKHLQVSLSPGDFYHIPKTVKDILQPGLMSSRTYGSRFKSWRPEKYLRVRIVPVEVRFLERRNNSQPYSSYCKGYGESHPSAHRQKTKFSSELDADLQKIEQDEELQLLVQSVHPQHLLSEYLLIDFERWWKEN